MKTTFGFAGLVAEFLELESRWNTCSLIPFLLRKLLTLLCISCIDLSVGLYQAQTETAFETAFRFLEALSPLLSFLYFGFIFRLIETYFFVLHGCLFCYEWERLSLSCNGWRHGWRQRPSPCLSILDAFYPFLLCLFRMFTLFIWNLFPLKTRWNVYIPYSWGCLIIGIGIIRIIGIRWNYHFVSICNVNVLAWICFINIVISKLGIGLGSVVLAFVDVWSA